MHADSAREYNKPATIRQDFRVKFFNTGFSVLRNAISKKMPDNILENKVVFWYDIGIE
jgi:hypothetical protein